MRLAFLITGPIVILALVGCGPLPSGSATKKAAADTTEAVAAAKAPAAPQAPTPLPPASASPTGATPAQPDKPAPIAAAEAVSAQGKNGASTAPPATSIPADEVKLETVTYKQLGDAVKAQRGKVVVIDIWADFCVPCKKEFHNLVDMHKRYAKDGVVCMSVTIDDLAQKEAALKFLKKQGATFANYLLDEKPEVWQEKWELKGVPAVFVFNREGKRAAKFDNDDPDKQFTYADVEKLVKELMK